MKLTDGQQRVLELVKTSGLTTDFYWTGGTLLSHYYLHHRRSFDIDLFTEKKFLHDRLEPFIAALHANFGENNVTERKIYDRWEYLIDAGEEKIRCDLVYYNGERKRQAPLATYNGLLIDSLPDIAANKTMAYIDRNEVKDLFDVYMLMTQKKFTAGALLDLVDKKFGSRFSEFTFWSESAKGLKNLETLRPYLLTENPEKQNDILEDIRHFCFTKGKDLLDRLLK